MHSSVGIIEYLILDHEMWDFLIQIQIILIYIKLSEQLKPEAFVEVFAFSCTMRLQHASNEL